MAQRHKFSKSVRAALAVLIAKRATPAARAARRANHPVHLAEGFEVWHLLEKALKTPNARLSKLAQPTGDWQHLLRHGGKATEIVSSRRESGGRKWKLQAIFTSPLAKRLDHVIKWLDHQDDSDALVRLLVVPKFGLHALWIEEEHSDKVVLIESTRPILALKPDVLYPGSQFLKILSEEKIAPMPPLKGNALKISRQKHSGDPFEHDHLARERMGRNR
jgi:hypothetical protein